MDSFQKIYTIVSLIPSGKVLTYKTVAKIAKIKNPRVVGFTLHTNRHPDKVPCHRVVKSNGSLAQGYTFGGPKKQKEKLRGEGIIFEGNQLDLPRYLLKPSRILLLYFDLLFRFGEPGRWPWFDNDRPHTKEEIAIGAILAQNTNWRNVQLAISNLRRAGANSLLGIYQMGKTDFAKLAQLIRPSGFYNQKAERLFLFCKFIIKKYKTLARLSRWPTQKIREDLLSLKGIGKETADTILLYSLNKPVFVIDAYTKGFAQKYHLVENLDYNSLQNYFITHLPKNTKLYQDYHALIVRWGKTNTTLRQVSS